MKTILRTLIFSIISIYLTQIVIGAFVFAGNTNITFILILLALTILNVFAPLVLRILSLPSSGPGYIFLGFILNLVVLYILTMFMPSFSVVDTRVSELIIFGIVLPSKSLTSIWALVFSSLLFVIILSFFNWLCSHKKH